jgi:hypothetical protein
VTKFHDSSTTTIALLDFLAGHLLAERHHHRAFFELRYGQDSTSPVTAFMSGSLSASVTRFTNSPRYILPE